jgi:hypothetical protein
MDGRGSPDTAKSPCRRVTSTRPRTPRSPQWQTWPRPSTSRLAVVPGYSHYNFISSPEVPQIVGKFLADRLTNPAAGAAAASQVAPAPEKTQ